MDVLEAGVVPVAENVESLQVEVQRLSIIRVKKFGENQRFIRVRTPVGNVAKC